MRKGTFYLALGIAGSMLLGGCSFKEKDQNLSKGEPQSVEMLQTIDTESTTGEPEDAKNEAGTEGELEETEIKEEPLVQKICVTATGDCTLGKMQDHGYEGSFCWYYDKKGPDYFFGDVKSVFEKDDFNGC